MAKCDACGKNWPMLKVFQRTFTVSAAVECPHCDEKQYIKNDWKRIVIPLLILAIVPVLMFTIEMTMVTFLIIFSISALLAFLYMVFSVKLSSTEDWKQN